nr:hypothetical protein [Marinicaulis flavus]
MADSVVQQFTCGAFQAFANALERIDHNILLAKQKPIKRRLMNANLSGELLLRQVTLFRT